MENNTDNSMYRVGDIVIGSSDPSKSVYSITGTKVNPDGVSLFGSSEALTARAKDLARSAVMAGGIPLPVNSENGKNSQNKKTKKKLTKSSKPAPFSIESYVSNVSHEHEIGHYGNHNPPYSAPYTPEPERTCSVVQFENDFGKIKSKVENIIEHELAFMLVYSDEDAMVFEPKVGELLAIYTPDKQRIEVYYPGVTFDSPDSTKKFMILFKVPAEDQE